MYSSDEERCFTAFPPLAIPVGGVEAIVYCSNGGLLTVSGKRNEHEDHGRHHAHDRHHQNLVPRLAVLLSQAANHVDIQVVEEGPDQAAHGPEDGKEGDSVHRVLALRVVMDADVPLKLQKVGGGGERS